MIFLRPLSFANDRQIKNAGVLPMGIYVREMKCFRPMPLRFRWFASHRPGANRRDPF